LLADTLSLRLLGQALKPGLADFRRYAAETTDSRRRAAALTLDKWLMPTSQSLPSALGAPPVRGKGN